MDAEPFQFGLRAVLATATIVSICCGLLVWNALAGALGLLVAAICFAFAVSRSRRHLLEVFLLSAAIGVLLTAAFYRRTGSARAEMGVPFHWLHYYRSNVVDGPVAHSYDLRSAFEIRWLALAYAVALATVLGAAAHLSWRLLVATFSEFAARGAKIGLVFVSAFTFTCMAVVIARAGTHGGHPLLRYILVFNMLVLVPLILAMVAWRNKSYPYMTVASLMATVWYWLGFRIGDHFSLKHGVHDVEWEEELLVIPFVFVVLLLISFLGTFVGRSRSRRRENAS